MYVKYQLTCHLTASCVACRVSLVICVVGPWISSCHVMDVYVCLVRYLYRRQRAEAMLQEHAPGSTAVEDALDDEQLLKV